MGRKEDEEDNDKVSKETNGNCLEELTKKCKPLNIQLNRLEIPKNGVIRIPDNLDRTVTELKGSQLSSSNINKEEKIENEDTAETIKKIKEFIALGRSEDAKKEQDSSEKKVGYKSKPIAKRKLLSKKDAKKSKKSTNRTETLQAELELERTLEGQDSLDDCSQAPSILISGITVFSGENKKLNQLQNVVESKVSSDVENLSKNNDLLTPSRVSKRIQSKSVKFSAKKLLRGDDVNVLKRMIPGYQENIPPKKEKVVEKKVKSELKKGQTTVKQPSPVPNSPVQEKEVVEETPQNVMEVESPEVNTEVSSEPFQDSAPLESETSSIDTSVENKEKLAAFSDKIGKFAIGNGKITLELKGSQQKKVVRIAIPPVQAQSSTPKASLGPDIIIKRVKPVKKTVVIPDNSLGQKSIIEKELVFDNASVNAPSISKEPKVIPRVNIDKISSPKLKENLVKLHKRIDRIQGKLEKKDKIDLKEKQNKKVDELRETIETRRDPSGTYLNTEINKENESRQVIPTPANEEDETVNTNKSAEIVTTESSLTGEKEATKLSDAPKKDLPVVERSRGRRPANVTQQLKSKSESQPRKPGRPPKKIDAISEKSLSSDEPEFMESEKETYENVFDRFFSTTERYVEHNDSLESDSSEEFEEETYAHFINLRKHNEASANFQEEKKDDTLTMYDLMQTISLELPTWNIHVTSDGQAFCLAQVDLVDSVPVMKKVIEVDLDYNAKVFVNGAPLLEYQGNYSGYEEIRQLIYDVDQL